MLSLSYSLDVVIWLDQTSLCVHEMVVRAYKHILETVIATVNNVADDLAAVMLKYIAACDYGPSILFLEI